MLVRTLIIISLLAICLSLKSQTPSSNELIQVHNTSEIYMNSLQANPGSLIYNIDKKSIYQYNGSTWISLSEYQGISGSVLFLNTDGNIGENNDQFYYDSTNNRLFLGAGLTDTGNKLNVRGSIRGSGINNSNGTLELPSYRFSSDSNTGFYRPVADNLSFVTKKTEAIRIDKNQNVGIGTSTPLESLHISENMQLDGYLKDSNSQQGTIGQVLSSTSQGILWTDKDEYAQPTVLHKTSNYTLSISDSGKVITFDSSSSIILNIPEGLPEGFNISVYQIGIGQVSIIGIGSVQIKHRLNRFKTAGQDSGVGIISTYNNTYHLTGDLSN